MIKKIQKNKKINNQDKQQPKNIQELMQRYDLDNNKIEEYLDYLIDYLIQQKQELDENKVSKSGDKMTGDLILDNSHYIRGISNNGTNLTLIRAYNVGDNIVAIGDTRAEARIWSKSKPTIKYPDGTIETIATREQKILWQGALYMTASQTARLSEKISEQNNGIVLFFKPYSNGQAQSWGYYCKYIPKQAIATYGSGYGYNFIIPSNTKGIIATKYLYINDDSISGNAANVETYTIFGTSVNNTNAVLTAVFGV